MKTYNVTVSVENAPNPMTGEMFEAASETVTVEADREGMAQTRAMIKTTIKTNGRKVSHVVVEA